MRKFLAFLLIIVLVIPLMTASLLILPVRTWIFDRSFYNRAISGQQLSKLLQSSTSFPVQLQLPVRFSQVTMDALYGVIKQTLTPAYLDSQVQPILDSALNLVEGKATSATFQLDLKPIKTALLGDKRDQMLAIISDSIPVCAAGQSASQSAQVCRPSNVSVQSFTQTFLTPALTQVMASLPDAYNVTTPDTSSLTRFYFWQSTFPGMTVPTVLTLLTVFVCLLALLFWLISALVADPDWGVRLQWLGGALIVPALIVLAVAALVQWLNPGGLLNFGLVQVGQTGLAPELKTALTSFIQAVSSSVARPFFLSGGIALFVAIVLYAWGAITKPRAAESESSDSGPVNMQIVDSKSAKPEPIGTAVEEPEPDKPRSKTKK
jgi:hypothetical protein